MDETRAQAFTSWLERRLARAGYRLHERGERTRLTRDSGIPPASINRLLSGTSTPTIDSLEQLANFLGDPLSTVLVGAGWLTSEDIDRARTRPATAAPITTDEALDELGITDPADRRVVEAVIDTVKRHRPAGDSERTAE